MTVRRAVRVRWTTVLACAALACAALAWPRPALAHHGAPVRVVADRRVGPYVVSVWTAPDVGMGMVYVVYDAPAGVPAGVPFVVPTTVRVGVAPASGRLPESLHDARSEAVRHGARFVAHVPFDRAGVWRVRVATTGPSGGGELTAWVDVAPAGAMGPAGILFYASPFLAVAALWSRAAAARRRASGTLRARATLASS